MDAAAQADKSFGPFPAVSLVIGAGPLKVPRCVEYENQGFQVNSRGWTNFLKQCCTCQLDSRSQEFELHSNRSLPTGQSALLSNSN